MDAMKDEVEEQTKEQKRISKAVRFATKKHDGQFRKDSDLPYIVHPMAVLSQIAEWEITDQVPRLAAVTHDVREDCGVTYEELVAVVGKEAADVVEELSFFPDLRSDIPKHIQKQDYMRSFATSSIPALAVKFADRCCNTYDWLAAGNPYAKKYWKKADDLFSAFITRREEVIEYFGGPEKIDGRKNPQREVGLTVFIKMQHTRTCITGMVQ
jgi:(p)ppGpp synthase/HD superfamily hydrolase